jgi:tetratricopeptide (TPR) repeat protein
LRITFLTKVRKSGEGRKSFPYFFPFILFLQVLGLCLFPVLSSAQKPERAELSSFDRLAEKATLLNQHGKFDEVISLLEPYKGDSKNDSALFFNELGIAYRNKNRLDESIQAYRQAHTRDPQNPVILNNLGYVYYLKKEYPQAIEQMEKAIHLAPRFKEAHSNLALVYYQLQRYDKALKEIDVVLALDPSHEAARKFRDTIRKKMQDQKK